MDTEDDKATEPRIATSSRSLGCVGYEAYAKSTGGKTFDGRDMPKWSELPERIVSAWESAALAIVDRAVMAAPAPCCSPERPHVLGAGDPLPDAPPVHHIVQMGEGGGGA